MWFLLHFFLRIYFYMHQKFLCICVRLKRISQNPAPGMVFFRNCRKTENTFRSNMSQLRVFSMQFCKHCLERLGNCVIFLTQQRLAGVAYSVKQYGCVHHHREEYNIMLCHLFTLYNDLNYFSTCRQVTIQISIVLGLEGEDSYSLEHLSSSG